MSEEREREEGRVKVKDRRRFVLDDDGNVVERPDAEPRERTDAAPDLIESAQQQPEPAAPLQPAAPQPAPEAAPEPGASQGTPPSEPSGDGQSAQEQLQTQIFLEFLNSLAHSMLVHLGEVPDPGSGIVRENLEAAQQTLEILSVLRQKTDGNLTAQESRLFDQLLYELMMRFRQKVEQMSQPGPGPAGPAGAPRGGN
ncbi:MAG: DUF1844 domain-containing protein [Candidatus Dadabacteria bacterium]|nr:MAG: DUF1844 domain-containing protein [Candidatus Dadabacteria bacterium]